MFSAKLLARAASCLHQAWSRAAPAVATQFDNALKRLAPPQRALRLARRRLAKARRARFTMIQPALQATVLASLRELREQCDAVLDPRPQPETAAPTVR